MAAEASMAMGGAAPAGGEEPESNKLYVGNLSWGVRDDELKAHFASWGATEARVVCSLP